MVTRKTGLGHPTGIMVPVVNLVEGISIRLNFFANSTAVIKNRTPHRKLDKTLTAKTPTPLPIRNAIPIIPLIMNSHLIRRSGLASKAGARNNNAIP